MNSPSPRSACERLLLAIVFVCGAGTLGAQTFTSHGFKTHLLGPVPEDLVVADLDADGALDVAVGNSDASEPPGGAETISILLNDGDGGFDPHVEYAAGDRPEGLAAGNFDANATLDLAAANFHGNTVSILLGDGDGTFTAAAGVAVPGGPRSVVAGDFDGDSLTDLATANHGASSVSFLKGAGNGTFTLMGSASTASQPEVIAKGRMNNDAFLDVVTANNIGDNVTVLHGNGSGGFTFFANVATGDNPRFVKVIDLNGDNLGDLVTANNSTATVTVHENVGGASFTLRDTLSTAGASAPIYVNLGDLDGDADLDMVVTYATSDKIGVYPRSGTFDFGSGELLNAGDTPLGIGIADFDGSGHLDIAISNANDDNLYLYLSDVGLGAISVDNTDPTTSKTGTWTVSGSPNPFGTNSVFAKASAATTFTWNASLPAAGGGAA